MSQDTSKNTHLLDDYFKAVQKIIDPVKEELNSDKERVTPVVECLLCKVLVGLSQVLMESMKTMDEIQDLLTKLCIFIKIKDDNICRGIIKEFKEEVLSVFDLVVLSPENFCGTIFGEQCAHVHHPHEFWNITLNNIPKPPVTSLKYPKPGLPTLRILQLSDIHVDFNYKVGGNAECNEPVCCKDIDGQPKGKPAGKWGDYRQCDTPRHTLESLFKHLKKNEKFDAIYWTGDLPGHNVWNQTRNGQLELLDYLANTFQTYFPDIPVFSTLGNHESVPVNSFPPPFIKGDNSIEWLYTRVEKDWRRWLPRDTFDDIRRCFLHVAIKRRATLNIVKYELLQLSKLVDVN
ncbi:DgyrCDS7346 [Dimorphilus gyrociliatus]|uniref:DgyrCDS7346 n=1 Tax=Dimorphilus gyrociliatus TaxID=2664684 RepID=A0A7I8VQR5_9ANNE|nr:DgyrCDS7346 [Dimorphilus gyrociliatus]